MDHKKDVPAKIKYSIWETKTNENLDHLKEQYRKKSKQLKDQK